MRHSLSATEAIISQILPVQGLLLVKLLVSIDFYCTWVTSKRMCRPKGPRSIEKLDKEA